MANGTLKVQNIETSSGSGTITLGQSGETITVPTGVTVSGAMSNTPSFQLANSTPQSIPNTSFTKMTFDTENWDTDNAVSSSTFTVPSGKAGKYWFQNTVEIGGIDTGEFVNIMIYVNGSGAATARWYSSGSNDDIRARVQAVLDLSEGDTVEGYIYHTEGGSQNTKGGTAENKFTGYRLIGV